MKEYSDNNNLLDLLRQVIEGRVEAHSVLLEFTDNIRFAIDKRMLKSFSNLQRFLNVLYFKN